MSKSGRGLLIYFPILLVIIGLILAYPNSSNGNVIASHLITCGMAYAVIALLIAITYRNGNKQKLSFMFVVLIGIIFISFFAMIYRGFGLVPSGSKLTTIDNVEALYFSIVTATTLGYGDFSPPPKIRLISAIQAIIGYVYLGFSVGLFLKSD